jgi:hypothetical protein
LISVAIYFDLTDLSQSFLAGVVVSCWSIDHTVEVENAF